MPALNATRADAVGPTIDPSEELSRPLFRQEPFQIEAHRGPGISLATKARPRTRKIVHGIDQGMVPVMVRNSNSNPANAGQGDRTSDWRLSVPGMQQLADDATDGTVDTGAEPAAGRRLAGIGLVAIVGIAVGVMLSRR